TATSRGPMAGPSAMRAIPARRISAGLALFWGGLSFLGTARSFFGEARPFLGRPSPFLGRLLLFLDGSVLFWGASVLFWTARSFFGGPSPQPAPRGAQRWVKLSRLAPAAPAHLKRGKEPSCERRSSNWSSPRRCWPGASEWGSRRAPRARPS